MSRPGEPLDRLLAAPLGDWQPIVAAWRAGADGERLVRAVEARRAGGAAIHPADVFRALRLTPLAATRVVILGQDPYHGRGQAEGLAFSVPEGVTPPPSLRNIFDELQRDLGLARPASGSLVRWAERGVLLLNAVLTVEEARAGSHAGLGWQSLTERIVAAAAVDPQPRVFMLWGAHARRLAPLVAASWRERHGLRALPHCVLQANHPSPLSARRPPLPFFGCGHFGKASRFLRASGRAAMDWSLQGTTVLAAVS